MKISPHDARDRLGEENHSFTLMPEDYDDIYTLSRIIEVGDEVEAVTIRKVLQENKGGDVVDSQRLKMTLRVRVEKIDIDLGGGLEGKGSIRLNGKNCLENKWVKLGSYHTLEIIPQNSLKLSKSLNSFEEEVLLQSLDSVGKCDIAAVMMFPENGSALLCQLGAQKGNSTMLGRVSVSMAKGKFASNEKSLHKFSELLLKEIVEQIPIEKMKAIILCSTLTNSKVVEDVWKELLKKGHDACSCRISTSDGCNGNGNDNGTGNKDQTANTANKDTTTTNTENYISVIENKHKFIRLTIPQQCSSPNDLSLLIETEPRMKKVMEETKSALEKRAINEFFTVKGYDEGRTTYGVQEVEKAAREGAVKLLLVSDQFVRSKVIGERKRYSDIISAVKENGGKIEIFLCGTSPSKELERMGGIASILLFPIY